MICANFSLEQIRSIKKVLSVIEKIVSGGQTGVDRAALDVALDRAIPCGGWCPKHRRAEDGKVPLRYGLTEADSPNYAVRTALNVRDSDGTLILVTGELSRGSALTYSMSLRYSKPVLVVNMAENVDFPAVEHWLTNNRIQILNVAGPRESSQPGIYDLAFDYLQRLATHLSLGCPPKKTSAKRATRKSTARQHN